MKRTGRHIAGNVLIYLLGFLLIGSAVAKLAHVPKVVSQLGAMGFDGPRLTFIAILESFCAVLFLIPASRSSGVLLVSAFLGGAIATHLQHGQSIAQPSVILALVWIGAWLRHPEILWSSNTHVVRVSREPNGEHSTGALKQARKKQEEVNEKTFEICALVDSAASFAADDYLYAHRRPSHRSSGAS